MNKGRIAPAIVATAMMLLLTGCKKSDPTAGTDWVITLSANPATVPLGNNPKGTTQVTARVYDKAGVVQQNVLVFFSASGAGSMASGHDGVRTDSLGAAVDTLTTGSDSTVTAQSGSISKTLDIKVGGRNTDPTAGASITPSGTYALTGKPVTFSSGSSSDTEDGVVTWSHWEISSDNPESDVAYDYWTDGLAYTVTFHQPQHLEVRLSVGDSTAKTYYENRTPPPAGTPGVGWLTTPLVYEIKNNLPPTAKINGSTFTGQVRQSTDGSGTYICSISVSGCASTDEPPGQVVSWEWNWGDRTEMYTTCMAQHTWTGLTASKDEDISLIVYDNGDGTCGPRGTGPDTCADRGVSALASAVVTCTVPTTP